MPEKKKIYNSYEEFVEENFPSLNKKEEGENVNDDPHIFGVNLARESLKKVTKILSS